MGKWYKNCVGNLINLEKFLYIDFGDKKLIGHLPDHDEDGIRETVVFDVFETLEEAELCMQKIEKMLGAE